MDDQGGNQLVEPSAQALGKSIGDARRAAGLTQQELCVKAKLSYSTLAKIERGAIKTPSVFTVVAIAEATGTSVERLVTGKEVPVAAPAVREYRTSRTGVKFVYFDINGVLVRFFHKAFSKLAQDTGASSMAIENAFWHYNDAVCRGEMSIDDFNSALASHIGQENVDWQSYYMDAVSPIEEVQECMRWASEHYRIGLLSNIMPGFIREMINRGILPDLDYNVIVDSSEQHAIKPESRIYELAHEFSQVEPGELLLIDDSRTNLMSAERLGWQVFWFDDFMPEESVGRIRSALELPE